MTSINDQATVDDLTRQLDDLSADHLRLVNENTQLRTQRTTLTALVAELLEWTTPSSGSDDPRWQQSHTSELVPRYTRLGDRYFDHRLKSITEHFAVLKAKARP